MRAYVFSLFIIVFFPIIFFYPYLGVLLYSWVSFMSPHRLAYGFPDEIPLAMITAVATMVSWLLSSEPKRIPLDATVWLIIIFMAYISVNTLIALNPTVASIRWDRAIKMLGFTLVTIGLTTNRIRFHALMWVVTISIGFYGLKGGLNSILSGGENLIYGPADSMIADNNDLALALAVTLPIINYVRLNSASYYLRAGLLVVMGASVFAILTTYSRGGLLALGAVGLFIWFKSRKKALATMVIPILAIGALLLMPDRWYTRMETITHYQEDASAEGRLTIWKAAVDIAKARPLTGGGFGATYSQAVVNTYEDGIAARAPHSIYFEVLGEQGFLAFFVWSVIAVLGWRNARWIERHSNGQPNQKWANDFGRMAQASLLAYFVGGAFLSFAYWDVYFLIVGMLLAVRHIIERSQITTDRKAFSGAFALQRRPLGG